MEHLSGNPLKGWLPALHAKKDKHASLSGLFDTEEEMKFYKIGHTSSFYIFCWFCISFMKSGANLKNLFTAIIYEEA